MPLGRRTVNTEPLPSSLATVTSPPIMRASILEVVRGRLRFEPLKRKEQIDAKLLGVGQDVTASVRSTLGVLVDQLLDAATSSHQERFPWFCALEPLLSKIAFPAPPCSLE